MAKRPSKAKTATDEPALGGDGAPVKVPPPLSLEAVIGQTRAATVLRQAISSGRMHHAWIFFGPVGVGKHTAARALAAELLTQGDATGEAKGLLEQGTHPDLHLVSKELAAVSRDQKTRDLKQTTIADKVLDEFLIEPAARSRVVRGPSAIGKVFIVDEAHLLMDKGQNTLLKLIEEPPEGTVLILVTHDEQRLLPTVRSRCQRVGFVPLTDTGMQQWLASRQMTLPEEQRVWLTSYASGSPGMLVSAMENGLYAWHQTLAPMLDALEMQPLRAASLGPAMAKCVDDRASAVVKANPEASKETANRVWGKRMIAFVAERIRKQLSVASRGKDFARAERLARQLDACFEAERHLDSNVLPGAVLDNLSAQLVSPGGIVV